MYPTSALPTNLLNPSRARCPRCSGGGFVTWKCVGAARKWARVRATVASVCLILGCTALGASGALHAIVTGRVAALPALAAAALARITARLARSAAQDSGAATPLHVECAEGDMAFSLAASDATADAAASGKDANAGDAAWVAEHTRRCPRCRAPILKNGGCNAMTCGSCRLHFCWACMRPMEQCGHMRCANGAPHGNASVWDVDLATAGERMASWGERAAVAARVGAWMADGFSLSILLVLLSRAGLGFAGTSAATAVTTAVRLAVTSDAVLALPLAASAHALELLGALASHLAQVLTYSAVHLSVGSAVVGFAHRGHLRHMARR